MISLAQFETFMDHAKADLEPCFCHNCGTGDFKPGEFMIVDGLVYCSRQCLSESSDEWPLASDEN